LERDYSVIVATAGAAVDAIPVPCHQQRDYDGPGHGYGSHAELVAAGAIRFLDDPVDLSGLITF